MLHYHSQLYPIQSIIEKSKFAIRQLHGATGELHIIKKLIEILIVLTYQNQF